MAMISQILNRDGREALLSCETAEEMHALLTGRRTVAEILERGKREPVVDRVSVAEARRTPLSRYLRPELLKMDLEGATMEEVVDELLVLLRQNGIIKDVEPVKSAVLGREDQMPTSIGHGVAIPHARTDAVDDLACAIGIKREGVDFGGTDSELSTIIVLTLSPREAPVPYVQFMAMISRALDAEGRERALSARSRETLWRTLTGS